MNNHLPVHQQIYVPIRLRCNLEVTYIPASLSSFLKAIIHFFFLTFKAFTLTQKEGWECGSLVEHLASMHETLGLVPSEK